MLYYIVKVLVSACLIVLISEIAKRSSLLGAFIASLPITSILAIIWIYVDSGDLGKISAFSRDLVWLVVPSLIFFIALPVLLERGVHFYLSVFLASSATAVAYLLAVALMKQLATS